MRARAVTLFVGAAILLSGCGDNAGEVAQVRRDMLAGCQKSASAVTRPYCGCLVDEMLRRKGTSHDELMGFKHEIEAAQAGSGPMPTVFVEAAQACVSHPSA